MLLVLNEALDPLMLVDTIVFGVALPIIIIEGFGVREVGRSASRLARMNGALYT